MRRPSLAIVVAAVTILAAGQASSQASLSFDRAIAGLASDLASSEAAAKPLRLAFLPLAAADATDAADKSGAAGSTAPARGFGLFFADRLAVSVKASAPKLRIFERQRLADLLAEAELDASGAVTGEGAMRLGELAPLDAVFTGSYSRVGQAVAIGARLVSVVTGEVLFSRALSVSIDESIRDFFPDGAAATSSAAVPVSDADRLKAALAEMKAALAKLSTEADVAAAAATAAKYPLFGPFAPVHELACETLLRYAKDSPAYRAFLVSSLACAAAIDFGNDTSAEIEAIGYLALDARIDDEEFAAGLAASRAMSEVGYYSVVWKLLLLPQGPRQQAGNRARLPVDKAQLSTRIASIMGDIKAGQMGRPAGIEYSRGLLELLGALKDDTGAFLSAYDPYAGAVSKERLPLFASPLRSRFEAETDPSLKSRLLERVAANANAIGEQKNYAADLYGFLSSLDGIDGGEAYARDFARLCGPLLAKAMPLVPYNKDERILLCLRYGIDCPGLVPAFDDIVRGLLLGDDIEARRSSASMLQAMGARAAPATRSVDKLLGFIGDGSIDGMGSPNLQMQCYDILANAGARDAASLSLIAAGMRHSYSDVRDAAADAFLRIGASSTPYVLEIVRTGKKEQKLDALKLLVRMGSSAAGASEALKKALASEGDAYVREAISDALSRIE